MVTVLFDIDDTLLFRREVWGQMNLHWKAVAIGFAKTDESHQATIDKISPRPDHFFSEDASFVYLRPNISYAIYKLQKAFGAENIHAFSASSNPEWILNVTDLRQHFNKVFGREYTHFKVENGFPILQKDLAAVRTALGLSPSEKLFIIDDHAEWIINAGPQDTIIPIKPFTPAYILYGSTIMKYPGYEDPTDKLPEDNALVDVVKIIRDVVES